MSDDSPNHSHPDPHAPPRGQLRPLSAFLEEHYLRWQLQNGRATIEEFAKFLGVTQPYLSALMVGRRKSVSQKTALAFAQQLGDYEILDILGYARPNTVNLLSSLSPDLRDKFLLALSAARDELSHKGITEGTPEALSIVMDAFAKQGIQLRINSTPSTSPPDPDAPRSG